MNLSRDTSSLNLLFLFFGDPRLGGLELIHSHGGLSLPIIQRRKHLPRLSKAFLSQERNLPAVHQQVVGRPVSCNSSHNFPLTEHALCGLEAWRLCLPQESGVQQPREVGGSVFMGWDRTQMQREGVQDASRRSRLPGCGCWSLAGWRAAGCWMWHTC